MEDNLLIECLKVNANYLSIYNQFANSNRNSIATSDLNFKDNFHDLKMSSGAAKTIKKAVNVILYLTKKKHFAEIRKNIGCTSYRSQDKEVLKKAVKNAKSGYLCTFLTLTLPAAQKHTDTEITQYCLNPFLTYARKVWKVKYYVWKKELQENGNLHFHLVTDRYIDNKCLRREWNKLINAGVVEGVENPFDYVDRYSKKMKDLYKDGFSFDTVKNFITSLPSIQKTISEKINELQNVSNQDILNVQAWTEKFINSEVDRYYCAYQKEIKKPENERFRNPNSTDIDAVKTPQAVSLYCAKYISKDITDNECLTRYVNEVENIKKRLFAILYDIKEKKNNDENIFELEKQVEEIKEYLKQYRKQNCPILGKLWYKSASLTPFVSGTSDVLYSELRSEVDALTEYLKKLQDKKNQEREKKRLPACNLIIKSYEKNDDGSDCLNKVICTTLLINIFDLEQIKDENKRRFPIICQMWSRFVNDCINKNYKDNNY